VDLGAEQGGAVIFKQYVLGCLSQLSYLIGDEPSGRAVVVDAQRDVSAYLNDAAAHGLRMADAGSIRGLAWSGAAPIARVDVCLGDGPWAAARLLDPREPHRWQR
jgi:hypothetical protein